MRTLFDTDEDEIEGKPSEITLSTASLLGIFFGLVLVCGVFFGFGYSIGRTGTTAQAKPVANPTAGNTGEAEEASSENSPAQAPAPRPVARQQDEDETPAKATPPKISEVAKEDAPQALRATVPVAAETPAQLVTSKPAAGKVGPAYQPPTDTPATTAGQPMVQIAAVS